MNKFVLILLVSFSLVNQAGAASCSLAADRLPVCASVLEKYMQVQGGEVMAPISCFNDHYAVFAHFEDGGYISDNVELFDVNEATCEFVSVRQ